jgi:hypothetical protein
MRCCSTKASCQKEAPCPWTRQFQQKCKGDNAGNSSDGHGHFVSQSDPVVGFFLFEPCVKVVLLAQLIMIQAYITASGVDDTLPRVFFFLLAIVAPQDIVFAATGIVERSSRGGCHEELVGPASRSWSISSLNTMAPSHKLGRMRLGIVTGSRVEIGKLDLPPNRRRKGLDRCHQMTSYGEERQQGAIVYGAKSLAFTVPGVLICRFR